VLLGKIIKTARKRFIIIDAYVDASTFEMLDVRAKGVKADIYSGNNLSNLQKTPRHCRGTGSPKTGEARGRAPSVFIALL
jgi:hypothetical protein